MPPTGADGQPDWKNHDWLTHIQQETPEEKSLYQKAQFYINRGRKAEQFGLPGADGYYKLGAFYGQQYETQMRDRLGFEKQATLQQHSEEHEDAINHFVQDQENKRAKLSKTLQEQNMTQSLLERESDQVIRDTAVAQQKFDTAGIDDPDQVKPIADSINARIDHLDQEAKAAGIPFDASSLRQKLTTKETSSMWRSFFGAPAARSSSLEPESSPDTESDVTKEGDAATVAKSGGPGTVAPTPIRPTSLTEGTIIRNPRTGERMKVSGGKLIGVDDDGKPVTKKASSGKKTPYDIARERVAREN